MEKGIVLAEDLSQDHSRKNTTTTKQAPIVWKEDYLIHWINLYQLDSKVGFIDTYQLESDLSFE